MITVADVEHALASEPKSVMTASSGRQAAAAAPADQLPILDETRVNELHHHFKHGEAGLLPEMEKEIIIKVLNQVNGKKQEAARILGISSTTLWRRLKKLGLQ